MDLPLQNIENLIPQKQPFVMVDALLDFSETALSAGFKISPGNIFFENGNLQAAGLLEHQAQSVALHTGYRYFLKNEPAPTGYIGAIKQFEVARLPKAGEELVTTIHILAEMDGITLVKTQTSIGKEIIASSEMKTVIA